MQIGAYRSRSLAYSGYVYSEMKYVDTSKSMYNYVQYNSKVVRRHALPRTVYK